MTSAEQILKQYWGFEAFRPLQKEVIESILASKDVIALLPTGGGKSITYQLPAMIMDGFCLVISPLIALMQDQVKHLKNLGISAACLHAGMHYTEVKRTLENTIHGGYKLLYVSPERLQSELFNEYLPSMNINLIAVDEAHCISQWGYDFRPDYLKVTSVKDLFDDVPVLALTATATAEVRQDIADKLKLIQPLLYVQSFERKNIFYSVQYTENKNSVLMDSLSSVNSSSIIYCRSRRQTEVLVKYLSQNGIKAAAYHAGIAKDKRVEVQELWMNNAVKHIVATTAFGMGIDKPDVGLVLHYDAPEHLEAYYQEAGRAGRNGKPARSVILFNNTDIKRLQESTSIAYPDEAYLKKIYQAVAEYLQIPIGVEPDMYYSFDIADFCLKFRFDALPASAALKLLEQEGLWTLTEAVFTPNTVFITASKANLEDALNQYPQFVYFATNLLRMYGTLFQYPTAVRLGAIANKLKIKAEEVEYTLQQLQALGILEYCKPMEGPQLYFHHYRVDSRHLLLNMKRIEILKKRHEVRTIAMLNYLKDLDQCRTQLLLAYFDEVKAEHCLHCDICLNKIKARTPDMNKDILDLLSEPLSISELLKHFMPEQKESIIAAIRKLVDERQITVSPNQIIQKV